MDRVHILDDLDINKNTEIKSLFRLFRKIYTVTHVLYLYLDLEFGHPNLGFNSVFMRSAVMNPFRYLTNYINKRI